MIAAIGTDGRRPVVWGLGATTEWAIAEARRENADWGSQGSATVEIDDDTAAAIDPAALGIAVEVGRDGRIKDATWRPALGWRDPDRALEASRTARVEPRVYDLTDGSYAAAHEDTIDDASARHHWAKLRDGRLVRVELDEPRHAWVVVDAEVRS